MSEVEVAEPTRPLESVPQLRDPPPPEMSTGKENQPEVAVKETRAIETIEQEPNDQSVDSPGEAPVPREASPISSPETLLVPSMTTSNIPKVVTPMFGPLPLQPLKLHRAVSLDRGRDMMNDDFDDDLCPSSDSTEIEGSAHRPKQTHDKTTEGDDSSPDGGDEHSSGSNTSDGESSYFAKHLPSPKSGRRFSYSSANSTHSAPARADLFAMSFSNAQRESDASLSFSDDDDEWNGNEAEKAVAGSRRSPLLPPTTGLQIYPQRITRMHSVSSLVSSSSDDMQVGQLPGEYDRRVANSTGLSDSSESTDESIDSSTSDPSVRSELRDVAASKSRTASRGSNRSSVTPSGRKSPVLPLEGESSTPSKGNLFGRFFPSPQRKPQPSPPTIFQGYWQVNAQDVAHPQPQSVSTEQMAAWSTAGSAKNQLVPPMYYPPPPMGYGATMMAGLPLVGAHPPQYTSSGDLANTSSQTENTTTGDSSITLPFVYSDDEDTDDSAKHGRQMAGRMRRLVGRNGATGSFERTSSQGESSERIEGTEVNDDPEMGGRQKRSNQLKSQSRGAPSMTGDGEGHPAASQPGNKGFSVYKKRWLMLLYMSVLNLMSDWTCYSVAPISVLTSEAFGKINPELLVVLFLGANAVATACEPIILSRLGLRRTVVFGALLLMMGSIVKSGGIPPILKSSLRKGQDEWRVYLGFFLVGLSQPLYQCTPALLSASWFPEKERTMATGVALNANQLGIGFAFIFGTLLVANSDDIPSYFGLLSLISTITFAGCLIQFEDAPPTPPSETARIIRGTLELGFPSVTDMIWRSVRFMGDTSNALARDASNAESAASSNAGQENPVVEEGPDRSGNVGSNVKGQGLTTDPPSRGDLPKRQQRGVGSRRRSSADGIRSGSSGRRPSRASSSRKTSNRTAVASSSSQPQIFRQVSGGGTTGTGSGGGTRRRAGASSRTQSALSDNGLRLGIQGINAAPSPAVPRGTDQGDRTLATSEWEATVPGAVCPPSPMMPGRVGQPAQPSSEMDENASKLYDNLYYADEQEHQGLSGPAVSGEESLPPGAHFVNPYASMSGGPPNAQWQYPYWDGHSQQQAYYYPPQHPYFYPQMYPHFYPYDSPRSALPSTGTIDDGAEPVLTLTPHHLDIDIRDDQVLLSIRACLSRPGFIHALVAFTVSGIVINTLSTFMDYLVRLNGAGREYVGIVGGSFQFVIMISSLIVGKQTDKTRAYYSVIVGMLVLGAFGLAECGVSLDADRGGDLRWALVVVAALVGPLQPVSTELGVDVAYPLSENTVLVIQQLFSNLLSALFIPFFKAVRDVGRENVDTAEMYERPQYTFSFYLLIVLHAAATVFFATFNGRYLRYEHELAKKGREEQARLAQNATAFHPVDDGTYYSQESYEDVDANRYPGESQPLLNPVV